jgi:RNA polymerase sigma factor (sigma-70 family)
VQFAISSLTTKPSKSPSGTLGNTIAATDGELLMRFTRRRDQQAFAEIVERHGRLVWMVCRQILGNHHDIEDAFQATFLILAERARSIRSSDSAAAWLYKVAMRTALSARRKRSRRREEALVKEPPADEGSLRLIDDRELLYMLLQELATLPARYQTPFVMRYLEGQSRRAIAEKTDSTVAQIQGRLARGRRMLRSRFFRRGMSLWMASGAIAGNSLSAKAAVTPSLIENTAKTCLAVKATGNLSALSPAVLELTREGLRAMWITFIAKSAAVVGTALAAAGIAWTAQHGDSARDFASGAAPVQVELLAAAGGEQQPPAKTIPPAGDAEQLGLTESAAILDRLKHKVPIQIGQSETKDGARIEIEEIRGTRPRIEVGGQYWVRGKYVLPPGQKGKLCFYETSSGEWGRTPTQNMDLQQVTLDKPSGEFELMHGMQGPGYFHLVLTDADNYSNKFANVYFGTGDNVLRKEQGAASDKAGAKQVVTGSITLNSNQLAQVTASQPDAQQPNLNATNFSGVISGGAGLTQAGAGTLTITGSNTYQTKYRDELAKTADGLGSELLAKMSDRAEKAADLEMQQLDKSLLQRELEQLQGMLLQLRSEKIRPKDGESDDEMKKRENLIDMIGSAIPDVRNKLNQQILKTTRAAAELERQQFEVNQIQKRLDEVARLRTQAELPQKVEPAAPPSAGQSVSTPVSPNTFQAAPAEQLSVSSQTTSASPPRNDQDVVQPHDMLRVRVLNALVDDPIADVYPVESMGTIALGPSYGRVKVAGLSVLDAEEAVKKHLAEIIEDPQVQVTMSAKSPTLDLSATVADRTASATDFPRAIPFTDQFEKAVKQELEQLHRSVAMLMAENAELKNRLQDVTSGIKPGIDAPMRSGISR